MQVSVREVTPSQHMVFWWFSAFFLQIFRSQIFDYVTGESFLFPLRSWPRRHTAEVSPVLFAVSMFDERLYLMLIFNMLVGMNVVFLIFYWWAVCFAASDIKRTIEIHFGNHTVIMRMLDMMQRRHEWHCRFNHENVRFYLLPSFLWHPDDKSLCSVAVLQFFVAPNLLVPNRPHSDDLPWRTHIPVVPSPSFHPWCEIVSLWIKK